MTRIDPDASEKRYLLGADYFNKGLVEPALEELLKAVELDPDNPDAHNLLGLVFLRKAAEAEELSTRNQCLKGEELRSRSRRWTRQFKKAEEQLQKASTLKHGLLRGAQQPRGRGDPLRPLRRGGALEDEGARQHRLSRAVRRAGQPRARPTSRRSDFARAAKALRQALFDQPKFCVGRYRLAKVYYEQKDWDHAAEELEQVTSDKACPDSGGLSARGVVALRTDDRDKASQMFSAAWSSRRGVAWRSECTLAQ